MRETARAPLQSERVVGVSSLKCQSSSLPQGGCSPGLEKTNPEGGGVCGSKAAKVLCGFECFRMLAGQRWSCFEGGLGSRFKGQGPLSRHLDHMWAIAFREMHLHRTGELADRFQLTKTPIELRAS